MNASLFIHLYSHTYFKMFSSPSADLYQHPNQQVFLSNLCDFDKLIPSDSYLCPSLCFIIDLDCMLIKPDLLSFHLDERLTSVLHEIFLLWLKIPSIPSMFL